MKTHLLEKLQKAIPGGHFVTNRPRLLAYGTDGGFYRLIPKLAVRIASEAEVQTLLRTCRLLAAPLTFRGSGTSLSGQAITDSILVMLTDGWNRCDITEQGRKITLGMGITGGEANRALSAYGRKIGPDPASIQSATIAGIVANNSSGMACGTAFNSYNTVSSMRIVFTDGSILDTGNEASRKEFLASHHQIAERLLSLRCRVMETSDIREKIQRKFSIKNTTGYAVNALLDFDDPVDMIEHLMVGSEGTLGFISEVTLNTIEDLPEKATSLLGFDDLQDACEAVSILRKCNVAIVELMDRRTVAAVEDLPGIPDFLKTLGPNAAVLLVETQASDHEKLAEQVSQIKAALEKIPMPQPVSFCSDESERCRIWEVRDGFDPIIFAKASPGSIMVTEDIAVFPEQIKDAVKDLHRLFDRYRYEEAVVFGHVLAGNLHFNIIVNFASDKEVKHYQRFMEEMTDIVARKYGGSFKAEHGTGRNMAPFVRKEWGDAIYGIMEEIKKIFDPQKILNPGVILNDDPEIHVRNLKHFSLVDPMVDRCIECGFCERVCVSNGLTLSARQRIILLRYLAWLRESGEDSAFLKLLEKDIPYLVMETCATDGLCSLACPSGINTGNFVKKLRSQDTGPLARLIGKGIGNHMAPVTATGRLSLHGLSRIASCIGDSTMKAAGEVSRKLSGQNTPRWMSHMPGPQKTKIPFKQHRPLAQNGDIVYIPSCINRTMGENPYAPDRQSLIRVVEKLCLRAGYIPHFPEKVNALCCGLAFASKGQADAARQREREMEAALLKVSRNGKFPIFCDTSPCLLHMKETLSKKLKFYDPTGLVLSLLAPHLTFHQKMETVVIHPVCSVKKMGLEKNLIRLAEMCAKRVVSTQTNCCGFAGDRGFVRPELNRHGLRNLNENFQVGVTRGFSTSRTCEIGLSEESGVVFSSILYLVDECTR